MAAAAAAFDSASPPPELSRAWEFQRWGIGNIMDLPAGLLQHITAALNVYEAVSSYQRAAGNTVKWTTDNPKAWQLVSYIIGERRKHG